MNGKLRLRLMEKRLMTGLLLAALSLVTVRALADGQGASSYPRDFHVTPTGAFFAAGASIWKTDGTREGTREAVTVEPGRRARNPLVYRDRLFYFSIPVDRSEWRMEARSGAATPKRS